MWPPNLEHTCHLPWCFWPSASSPRGAAGCTCTACGPAPAPRRCWGRYSRGIGVGPSPFAACAPVPTSVHTIFIHSHKRHPRRRPLSPPFAKGGRGGFLPDVAAIPCTNRMWTDLAHRWPDDPSSSPRVADPKEVTAEGSDIESPLVGVPEGAVGGGVHPDRHRVGLQDPALGVPDVDHRAWAAGIGAGSGDDVAVGIEAHPINASLGTPVILAKLMQHGIPAQGTVGQNVVGPELAEFRTGLDDVEGLLIRREQEAVGPGRIVRHAPARPGTVGLRIGPEDRVMVQHLALTGVDVDRVPGVAKP